ncbi:hypothetical protein DH2020_036921 [Rehmannia glutinosa]|uniref:PWWP domain-containing protein n=1 Tax=Rehmannia glutinosa TaxID=99300 RepID=A0ABR0V415_REHGL
MASLKDIVEATKILAEKDGVSDVKKDDNGSCSAVGKQKEENGVLSNVLDGGTSGAINEKNVGPGVDDNVVNNDEKIKNGEISSMDNVDADVNRFRVGDFVWGKIKSHPWWPGQVYNPNDASDFAVKHSQEGRLLVAFFGDGSCSWCLPSQLVPFAENFKQMSMDSSSKSFHNAIQSAVDEVGRIVEYNMTCKCVPMEKRDGLARPVVSNAGVKSGVLVPEVDIRRLSVPEYEPVGVLEKLMNYAKTVSVDSLLELAFLKSWLSAFYCAKGGGYQLAVYCEPVFIEGLEDKNKNSSEVSDDFGVPDPGEVPPLGPQEDDWLSSPGVSSAKSRDDKIYHRRKQKSVAELMGEDNSVEPKNPKRTKVKEEKDASSRKKRSDDPSRKRKVEKRGKPKEIKVDFAENNSGEAKEEPEKVFTPRERKKSKYLSPPYTNPTWRMGDSSSKTKSESDKSTKIDRSASPPICKLVDKASDEEMPNVHLKATSRAVEENDKKMTFSVSDVDVRVDEMLSEVEFAAVDPLYLSKKGSFDMVYAFVSARRSSTYLHGADYKIFQKPETVRRRRKSKPSRLKIQKNEDVAQEKPKSPDSEAPKSVKTEKKAKSKKAAPSSLLLTFTPEFPLPSKEEIVRLFGKFGSLNENETNVLTDSHSVRIVYTKDSDAELAFKSSVSESPFGVENVNYLLQHSSAGSQSQPKIPSPQNRASEKPTDDFMSYVRGISQKLEIMTAILENYHSKFSTEEKSSLKEEMKHLMENVEMVSEKVQVMAENTSS